MIKKIINTVLSRGLVMGLSFLMVILTTRYLGSGGRGEASLWLAQATLISMLASFAAGPALIYFASRKYLKQLMPSVYISALVIALLTSALLYLFTDANLNILLTATVAGVIITYTGFNQNILIGYNQIRQNNELQMLQAIISFAACALLFITSSAALPIHYIVACLFSFVTVYVVSWLFSGKYILSADVGKERVALWQMMQEGAVSQWSNLAQFLNYRLTFFILDYWWPQEVLGKYSVAIALCESLWLVGKSIATVQLGEVAMGTDEAKKRTNAVRYSITSGFITLLGLIIFLVLPNSIYIMIFGEQFGNMGAMILGLAAGIIALSMQFSVSHYFAGKGIFKYNNYASVAGLIFTIGLAAVWVPRYGAMGAACASSIAYIVCTAILWIYYKKYTREHHVS
jgi:O-antigen/teichoic acid export membrane protein